ncbi:right-handed parallel beta-helix repeat-containing protein [candidate division KSB1 bacterium]|nr:right-handed parallel beta-helix repeat-containing protein [candidate division KSB1 bacterium]
MKRFFLCIFFVFVVAAPLHGNVITVINSNDSGAGSLRWAINGANAIAGRDTIRFNILVAGVQTIALTGQLPALTDNSGVLIDGLSQPGASTGQQPPATAVLMIEIDGLNAGQSHGLYILSSHNVIRGLVLKNFQRDGIRIEGTPNGSNHNIIYCNFIGSDVTGTQTQGNGWDQKELWAGVDILAPPCMEPLFAQKNVVEANLISDNYAEGVAIMNCPPSDVSENLVLQNYIGTDISGTMDFGNRHTGVFIGEGAHDNVVDHNLICGNDMEGISIVGYAESHIPTYKNLLTHNLIGIDISGAPLPNGREGVNIGEYNGTKYRGGFAPDNVVGPGNMIAYNGMAGVSVWEDYRTAWNADGNRITQNSIFDNGGLGIDLGNDGVTPNDPGDADGGPNQHLNHPKITSAQYKAGGALISGTISIDRPPNTATVEVFTVRPDPSGFGEGARYLGSTTPDAAGNWSVMVTGVAGNDSVTATTTDDIFNTSEFSPYVGLVPYTSIDEMALEQQPGRYPLLYNYPNPFNAETIICYTLPSRGRVKLEIYNALGERIRLLTDENQERGVYTLQWDGCDQAGVAVGSGSYYVKLRVKNIQLVHGILLLK